MDVLGAAQLTLVLGGLLGQDVTLEGLAALDEPFGRAVKRLEALFLVFILGMKNSSSMTCMQVDGSRRRLQDPHPLVFVRSHGDRILFSAQHDAGMHLAPRPSPRTRITSSSWGPAPSPSGGLPSSASARPDPAPPGLPSDAPACAHRFPGGPSHGRGNAA